MSTPKTRKVWAKYDPATLALDDIGGGTFLSFKDEEGTGWPVLVVPEEAVKKCKHPHESCIILDCANWWCRGCGALYYAARWQKPRILRSK